MRSTSQSDAIQLEGEFGAALVDGTVSFFFYQGNKARLNFASVFLKQPLTRLPNFSNLFLRSVCG